MSWVIGLEDVSWLREIARKSPSKIIPDSIVNRLKSMGLSDYSNGALALTAKGRVALAKLG
jgi:hypothetical protein